ncbi:MAG TPA: pyridoxamine 5'-phosphate oxidase family protein [Burkholderiaceae bacterium]|jgi:pyridoxine/pyridoxamine 5'-phosphate oxidase|nr:pyridoxamine 5'-phosphate oxidase family protein [Burkholderiaceae bacterium]
MTDPMLEKILESAWQLLEDGAADPQHGCHWPVLASIAVDGGPDARTVVLRAVCRERRELQVHSDARAGKLGQLARDPRSCVVFYDGPSRTQLRVHGRTQVHHNDAAALDAWHALPPRSQALYEGPQRFAVLAVAVDALDWLLIDPAGHRRAGFSWPNGSLAARWLQP